MSISYGVKHCYLGWVIIAATGRGVSAIEFGDDPERLPELVLERFPNAEAGQAEQDFQQLLATVLDFIAAPKDHLHIPLDIQGTVFQHQVWEFLKQIKPGQTMSYGEVASTLGKPGAARAVGSACASNRVAVAIPCHRVITKSGAPGAYRWGVERKKMLLEAEGVR